MTFKLRAQLDGDAPLAYALYEKYVENNRRHFPESVLALMQHPDWRSGGAFSRCPHDAGLSELRVALGGKSDDRIELLLSKPGGDVEILITYSGVVEFDFPKTKIRVWSYDQFKFYNPYHDHGIKETKMFQHEIEWLGGAIWTIRAREIEVVWRDI